MNIGDRIKQRRLELGFDAEDLAKRIGKSRATVYRYENGDIENMPTTVLEPIAKALNTTPAYLMGWVESDPMENYDNFLKKREMGQILGELSELGYDAERDLLNTFTMLNQDHKNKVLHYTKMLNETEVAENDILKAAHERTDIKVTEEMRKHDDDIMNDDSEWE